MSERWNHPICDDCWKEREPDREPVRIKNPSEHTCCFCGVGTTSGIWVRQDPVPLGCVHHG